MGLPSSMKGMQATATSTRIFCTEPWDAYMYWSQSLMMGFSLKSIMLMKEMRTDGAQYGDDLISAGSAVAEFENLVTTNVVKQIANTVPYDNGIILEISAWSGPSYRSWRRTGSTSRT